MMKSPVIAASFLYSLGILCAPALKISPAVLYGSSVILFILALCFFKRPPAFSILMSCLICLMGVCAFKGSQQISPCHLSKYFPIQGVQIIKGTVATPPELDGRKTTFIFKTEAIKSKNSFCPCDGKISVRVKGKRSIDYGDELILRGIVRRPYFRPAGFCAPMLRQERFIMSVATEADCVKLGKFRGSALKRLALRLKQGVERIIFRATTSTTAGILDAMVLGEKRRVPRFLLNEMMKSGTIHILVVSGFNVGLVSSVMMLFLKLLRLGRNVRYLLAIVGLFLYCLMTGSTAPVVRATLMAVFLILATLLKRESDIRHSFALAFLLILSSHPAALFDIGFQLSFACVFSLIILFPWLRAFLRVKSIRQKGIRFLLDALLTSLSCWAATAGFIAYYFKMFSPITLLANVFIVPLATLITLCGFTLVGAGLFSAGGALVFGHACDLLVVMLVKLNTFLVNLPLATFYLG
jgi:competence protein ComEC